MSECLSSRFTHIVFLFSGLSFISNWSYSLLPKPRLIPALGYFSSKPLPLSDLRLLPRGPNPIAITDRSRTYVRTTTARSSYTRSLSLHRSSSSLSLSLSTLDLTRLSTYPTSQQRLRGFFVTSEGGGGVWSPSAKIVTEGFGGSLRI